MQDALTLAIDSMQRDMQRVTAISLNLANVGTVGYKRETVQARPFAAAMEAATVDAATVETAAVETARGAGAPTVLDTSAGAMKATGRALDVALAGEGYFELATAHGPAYTRAGAFRLDARGLLVDGRGQAVQGVGGDIALHPGDVRIDAQGRIWQDEREVAQLKVVRFADRHALRRGTDGALLAAGAAEAVAAPDVRAGQLENSNVAPLQEIVALNETVRHFESVQRLFQGYEEQMSVAIRTLSEF